MSKTLREANWATWGSKISKVAANSDKQTVTHDLDSLTPEKFGEKYDLADPLSTEYLEPKTNRKNVFDRDYVVAVYQNNGQFSVTCRHILTDSNFYKDKNAGTIKYRKSGYVYVIIEQTDNAELAKIFKEDYRNKLLKQGLAEIIGVLPD